MILSDSIKKYLLFLFLLLCIVIFPVNSHAATPGTTSETAFENKQEAANYLLSQMLEHKTFILFYYKDPSLAQDFDNQLLSYMNNFFELACQHNPSNPETGDYLRYNAQRWIPSSGSKKISETVTCIEYKIFYNGGSLQNEKSVNQKVSEIISSLSLNNLNDRQKIEIIYRYVCENVDYADTTITELKNYENYSAYAALFHKKAYCQGFSSLLYRLFLQAGIDCRIISNVYDESIHSEDGLPDPDSHSWNIVKCDGLWYPLDATWDRYSVSHGNLKYFMPCSDYQNNDSFPDHTRAARYQTNEFYAAYPMAVHHKISILTSTTLQTKCSVCGKVFSSTNLIPKGTYLVKLTGLSKKIKIKWKKKTVLTKGYQIQYSLKSNFSKAKLVTITKNTTTTKTISKLKKKKTYYVRIRTYRIYAGKKFFSSWSKKKKVKVK